MSDDTDLRTVNIAIADWEQRRDADAIARLDRVLSPDLIFRRADGEVVDKAAFIAALDSPSPFATRSSDVVSVDVVGERALVVVVVTTTDAGGTGTRFRNVRALSRVRDGWEVDVWFNDRQDSG